MSSDRSPMARGTALAVLAALSFGASTPIVERAGKGMGPLLTASLLYAGACVSAVVLGAVAPSTGAKLRVAHAPRLVAVALVGAGVAPTMLAWGLQRAGATTGSLLLNLEAVFTALFAWALYREPIGRRVAAALSLMALGGALLTLGAAQSASFSALGAIAVVVATAGWALDNTLTRPLAELDPVVVVAWKGALGALMTGAIGWALGEPLPTARATLVLLACGATGYGLSLRLYLLAQRRIGAGRTGSIFAVAPFVGAALGWAMGGASPSVAACLAAVAFGVGVWLHVTEQHHHPHAHAPVEHDHTHSHDDGHHDHVHEPPFVGEHSHPHRHRAVEHDHDHAPDVHHEHAHG